MSASYNGHLEIVKKFIKAKANLIKKDNYGNTALSLANEYGHLEITEELANAGADIDGEENIEKDISDSEEEDEDEN